MLGLVVDFCLFYFHFKWKTFGSLYIWSHSELLTWEALGQPELESASQGRDSIRVKHVSPEVWVQMCHLPTGYLDSTQSTNIYWAPPVGQVPAI